jgi:hypothetical protein
VTQPVVTSAPARPGFVVAPVVGAAIAMQAVAWIVLIELFAIMRVGYSFFYMSDLGGVYYAYAVDLGKGMVAYRDFFLEYPPLFVPLLAAAGSADNFQAWVIKFAVMMVLFMIATGVITAVSAIDEDGKWRPYIVAGLFSICTVALGPISANRYDAVVALLFALAVFFMMRDGWEWAAVVLGIGFALKVTPAMLLPLILLLAPTRRAIRSALAFTVAAVTPFLWALSAGGQSARVLGETLSYHLDRPLEIESVLATPFWVAKLLGMTKLVVGTSAGSQVFQTAAANFVAKGSAVVLLAALGATFWLVWRRREAILASRKLLTLATLTTMLAALIGSKVLSPQYFVWLIPVVALIAMDRKLIGGLLFAALICTHIIFPANYLPLIQDQPTGVIVVLIVRNLLVVTAFALSLWALWRVPVDARPGTKKA